MVAYSFKQQFVAPILSGAKRQTIRADRKRHAREGELLQLYTGMRTRQCRLIGRAVCDGIVPIRLQLRDLPLVWRGDETLHTKEDLDTFARSDGFADWPAMRAFWRDNHPDAPVFSGILIVWRDLMAATERA